VVSTQLADRIRSLDDFRCVRFFSHFSQKLLGASNLTQEELLLAVPEDIRRSQELLPALGLPADARRQLLGAEGAVVCARTALLAFAEHPGFAGALEQALDDYRDDEMFADVVLAFGLAASMMIVAATSTLQVTYKDGKFAFKGGKVVAPASVVKEIVKSLAGLGRLLVPQGEGESV
jgi:hypothetical protein